MALSTQSLVGRIPQAAVVHLLLSVLSGLVLPTSARAAAEVPLLLTQAWQGRVESNMLSSGSLQLRGESKTQTALLIKHTDHKAIYRYDPHTLTISLISEATWEQTSGPVVTCAAQYLRPGPWSRKLYSPGGSSRLFYDKRRVPSAGATVLRYYATPNPEQAIVLSSAGPRRPSLFSWVLGSGGGTGQHYLQFFTVSDFQQVGESIRLPVESGEYVKDPCWSADGRFIVFAYLGFTKLFVVDLKAPIIRTRRTKITHADVPLLEMRVWLTYQDLSLRREATGQESLLFKHSWWKEIYRYEPRTQQLSLASDEDWRRASDPIAVCASQFQPPPQVLYIDPRSDHLFAGTRQVATAGTTPLDFRSSPSGRQVAVLSANGARRQTYAHFYGPGGTSRQHYHQLFSLPDVKPLGPPVALPLKSEQAHLNICWSADEQYIVYASLSYSGLAIVPTNTSRR